MELIYSPHRIYAQGPDGACIAEITFPVVRPGVWNIDHTFVDASLRGQGAAECLVRAVIEQAQEAGIRLTATCSYASAWFARHPECQSLCLPQEN